jgi:hypothetical protein
MAVLVIAGLALLATGCASPGKGAAYKLYPGELRGADQVAIIRMEVARATIDGMRVSSSDWSEVHVLPGRHQINWSTEFGASVMVSPTGFLGAGAQAELDLAAGHVYALQGARGDDQLYLWIYDTTSGLIVAGKRKP